jgi:hypothetical protein
LAIESKLNTVKLSFVSPANATPSLNHWYVLALLAVTLNVKLVPCNTAVDTGCVVILAGDVIAWVNAADVTSAHPVLPTAVTV